MSIGAIIRGVHLWRALRPIARWKARRQRKREAQLTSELIEIETTEDKAMLRTSTNAGIAGIVVNVALQLLGLVPALTELASSPEVASGLTVLVMWITARLSKTAENPGPL